MIRLAVACLVFLLAVSAGARADDSAQAHYAKGTTAYDLGHYAEAATEFERAYELHNDPTLLYNIGQAQRAAGNPERAIVAYRSYLRILPTAKNRPQVEASIVALQAQLDAQPKFAPVAIDSAPAAVVVAAPPPAKQPLYKKWWLWTSVGVAVVAVGLGVGLGLGLSHDHKEPIFPATGGLP
jgi:tetratricopeptide (TPR) repeat protein